jgi:hypothetical protein
MRKKNKLLKAVELYPIRRLKAIPRHMDFVRERGGCLAVSLLKTLRLEPFFLFVSLVESHTLAKTAKICICGTKMGTGSINPQDRRIWRTYPHRAETRRAVEIATTTLQR